MGRAMKLADYLQGDSTDPRKPFMTRAAFAEAIGASEPLITAYCNGSVWPSREKMQAIVRVTDAKVTANDFLQQHESVGATG